MTKKYFLWALDLHFSKFAFLIKDIAVVSTIESVWNNFTLSNEVVLITKYRFSPLRTYNVYIYWLKGWLKKYFLYKEIKKVFNNLPFPELLECKSSCQRL